jgi:decaprenylphospho-beta-D-erythro-pentofuranosid-2-ulose 2-reductase
LPPENEEFELRHVNKSMMINTVGVVNAIAVLGKRMRSQKHGHILHISTVAALRPRSRNFTYGASKSSADFFAKGILSKYRKTGLKVSILRPGYVYTKMSKNFKPAPFAITKEAVSLIVVKNLLRGAEVFYAPRKLRIVMKIFSYLPRLISDALSK